MLTMDGNHGLPAYAPAQSCSEYAAHLPAARQRIRPQLSLKMPCLYAEADLFSAARRRSNSQLPMAKPVA